MNTLQNTDCTNKKVLIRVDLNIERPGSPEASENLRLTRIKESLTYILNYPGSTVTLITHLGRPEGKANPQYSTRLLLEPLEAALHQKISFTDDCLGEDDFTGVRIALRENLRFYAEEETNDAEFAKK